MKRSFTAIFTALLLTALLAGEAFPWGWAVHTVINENLCEKKEQLCSNEIYGGIVTDFANDLFEFPSYVFHLTNETHNNPLPLWDAAKTEKEKALARGFVSHSETVDYGEFGADSTAHILRMTPPQDEGYVIAKARILQGIFEPVLAANGIVFDDPSVVPLISHVLVEYAIDIAITQQDPSIAQKMIDAAVDRNGTIKKLLVGAYAQGLADNSDLDLRGAARFIRKAEEQFRRNIVFLGNALLQEPELAVGLVSEQIADIAESYLTVVAPEILLDRELIVLLIQFGLATSLEHPEILNAGELMDEIGRTTTFVGMNLSMQGFDY